MFIRKKNKKGLMNIMNMRKRYQRGFNKLMRQLNQNIESDNLWKGRFAFRQINCQFHKFEDNSGGVLCSFVRAYDKRTGYYKDYRIEYAPYFTFAGSYLWEMANSFITKYADVWFWEDKEQLHPATSWDFRNVKVPEEIWKNKEYNWYRGYKSNV